LSPFKYNKVALQSQRWEVIIVIQIHLLLRLVVLVHLLSTSSRWFAIWISCSAFLLIVALIKFRSFFLSLISRRFSIVITLFLSLISGLVLRFLCRFVTASFYFGTIIFIVVIILIVIAIFSSSFAFQLIINFFFDLLFHLVVVIFEQFFSFLRILNLFLSQFINLFFKTFWSKWWTQSDDTEHLNLVKVNLKSTRLLSIFIVLVAPLFFTFLSFSSSTDYQEIVLFISCSHNLTIFHLLRKLSFSLFFKEIFLGLLCYLLRSWCHQSSL